MQPTISFRIPAFILLAFTLLIGAGCSWGSTAPTSTPAPSTSTPTATTTVISTTTQAVYVSSTQGIMAGLETDIENMEERIAAFSTTTRAQYAASLTALKTERDRAADRLDNVRLATTSWSNLEAGMTQAVNNLRQSYLNLKVRVDSQP